MLRLWLLFKLLPLLLQFYCRFHHSRYHVYSYNHISITYLINNYYLHMITVWVRIMNFWLSEISIFSNIYQLVSIRSNTVRYMSAEFKWLHESRIYIAHLLNNSYPSGLFIGINVFFSLCRFIFSQAKSYYYHLLCYFLQCVIIVLLDTLGNYLWENLN